MTTRLLILRWVGLVALSVWFGGFTFYGAVVIPVLHDAMESVKAGNVTRQVTDALNTIGVGTLVWWWGLAWSERTMGSRWASRTRLGLLGLNSAILGGLIVLHQVMDQRLDAGSLRGFYPLHRAYLIASTVQWAANVALVGVSLRVWQGAERRQDVPLTEGR
jgi:hypothetical protein